MRIISLWNFSELNIYGIYSESYLYEIYEDFIFMEFLKIISLWNFSEVCDYGNSQNYIFVGYIQNNIFMEFLRIIYWNFYTTEVL